MYTRKIYNNIIERLKGPKTFMQVLSGPRQVGKTTLAHQIRNTIPLSTHYASADEPSLQDAAWIEQQWEIGRRCAKQKKGEEGSLLILDEIQKIPYWSHSVKKLWDQDIAVGVNLKVLILGSSSLLTQSGLSESLAGRFEMLPISHWSFKESRDAFGLSLPQYIYFGGYPGASTLVQDEERWSRYVIDAIIETSLSRDILITARIHKPILLRRVFELGCHYSGQVISYQQMSGQLQDTGNVHTLAQYLHLLAKAGLVAGLQRFSFSQIQQMASNPKLQVLNTALTCAMSNYSYEKAQVNPKFWKSLIKSSIGAHLLNSAFGTKIEIFYWKDGGKEVDFIMRKGDALVVVGINDNQKEPLIAGLEGFSKQFKSQRKFLVGEGGMPIEEFLLIHPESLF